MLMLQIDRCIKIWRHSRTHISRDTSRIAPRFDELLFYFLLLASKPKNSFGRENWKCLVEKCLFLEIISCEYLHRGSFWAVVSNFRTLFVSLLHLFTTTNSLPD